MLISAAVQLTVWCKNPKAQFCKMKVQHMSCICLHRQTVFNQLRTRLNRTNSDIKPGCLNVSFLWCSFEWAEQTAVISEHPERKHVGYKPQTQPSCCHLHALVFKVKAAADQQLCDVDSWTQTYFQCGSRRGYFRRSETGAVLWSCICTQSAGEEALLTARHRERHRRHCCEILTLREKLISTNQRWQPGAVLWTPPCFCITADVAQRPGAWRDACRANRALSDWSVFWVLFSSLLLLLFFKVTA